jgi:hypothetical protein
MAHLIDLELLTPEQVSIFLQAALGKESAPDWLLDSFYQATENIINYMVISVWPIIERGLK